MKYKIHLLTLLTIFILSLLSSLLLFYNLNPENNTNLAISTMALSFFLMMSSLLTVLFFIFKKIYYRWNVNLSNIYSSLRQAIIIVFTSLILIFFNKINVLTFEVLAIIVVVWFIIEIIFQTWEDV